MRTASQRKKQSVELGRGGAVIIQLVSMYKYKYKYGCNS
jgi:hypothetical protein